MNPCVKTGFMFHDRDTGMTRTGDLFYTAGLWHIRGINPHEYPIDSPVDAVVANAIYSQRRDSPYMDSSFGIEFEHIAPGFREHLQKWYPELLPQLDVHILGMENDT